jgi:ornithine cyclodeaminase/alanine dehydrogenase-like protein (mu-crystallin family)
VNDWETVLDNDQTELLDPLKEGVIREDQIHELGNLLIGKVTITQPPRDAAIKGIIYFKNNSGLAIQFAAAGGIIYKKAIQQANNKTIPTEWLGSDLSSYYDAGFRPSP